MSPARWLFSAPVGVWVVVHRLHSPRCALGGAFDMRGRLEGYCDFLGVIEGQWP